MKRSKEEPTLLLLVLWAAHPARVFLIQRSAVDPRKALQTAAFLDPFCQVLETLLALFLEADADADGELGEWEAIFCFLKKGMGPFASSF